MARASSGRPNSPRSKPAENAAPSAVMTTTRTCLSSRQPASASIRSLRRAIESALRFSGRANVRTATPSWSILVRIVELSFTSTSWKERGGRSRPFGSKPAPAGLVVVLLRLLVLLVLLRFLLVVVAVVAVVVVAIVVAVGVGILTQAVRL